MVVNKMYLLKKKKKILSYIMQLDNICHVFTPMCTLAERLISPSWVWFLWRFVSQFSHKQLVEGFYLCFIFIFLLAKITIALLTRSLKVQFSLNLFLIVQYLNIFEKLTRHVFPRVLILFFIVLLLVSHHRNSKKHSGVDLKCLFIAI